MRRPILTFVICLLAALPILHAQTPELPVRRVVLYKNGVGYFEHVGRVRGTQLLAIDFDSTQLNDVLQTLTTVDLGGGRIGNISFNSEAPVAQRVGNLPFADGIPVFELLGRLRGTRVEIHSGARTIVGRVLATDHRFGGKDEPPAEVVTIATDAAEIHSIELTPSVSVKLLDRTVADQMSASLGVLASGQLRDRRRLTIAAVGAGDRDVLVSYISAVPVWKSTYRLVLPDDGGKAQLQGWAVVDNTVGDDWNDVALSLVAGAPQSFVQPLSQPLYLRRPTVDVAHGETPLPQVHQPTLSDNVVPSARPASPASPVVGGTSGGIVGGVTGGIVGGLKSAPPPPAAAPVQSEIYTRISGEPAAQGENVGDLFEYRATAPVTIRKNQSALVPILKADVEVERVSLWNDRVGQRPLRSVWLTNSTGLTLDAGAFSVIDGATFAGEGLVQPMKPGEKRLLSYGADLGALVEARNGDEYRRISRVRIERGDVIQDSEQRTRRVYTVRNNDATPRLVVIEHPIRPGWTLIGDAKPVETSANTYRFAVTVAPHANTSLVVQERRPLETRVRISQLTDDQVEVLVRDTHADAALTGALAPIRQAKAAVARLLADAKTRDDEANAIRGEQQRLRDNMAALKGSREEQQLLKRYVGQLNAQEDRMAALARERAELATRIQQAQDRLARLIDGLAFDGAIAEPQP